MPPLLTAARHFAALLFLSFGLLSAAPDNTPKVFDVPAGDASTALKQFANQAGQQVVFSSRDVRGIKTPTLKGEYTIRQALDLLLHNTDLVATFDDKTSTFGVRKEPESKNVARAIATVDRLSRRHILTDEGEKVHEMDTFEVFGQKTLNMDIRRSENDAQPYLIIDSETLKRSGSNTISEFLSEKIPMATVGDNGSLTTSITRGNSQINLRGFGSQQTLILVDGRRIATTNNLGGSSTSQGQPNIDGIPLSAIERIEILPTTASGIYGGGATGGVINIVLKRNYNTTQLSYNYFNTFDSDSGGHRIDISGGFGFGKTNIQISASYSTQNRLLSQDRTFLARARNTLLRNVPEAVFSGNPVLADTPNIRSVNGSHLVLKPQYGGTSLGSSITHVSHGYTGVSTDNGASLIANAGIYNMAPANTPHSGANLQSLVQKPRVNAVSASVKHRFSDILEAFVEAWSNNIVYSSYTTVSPTEFRISAATLTNPFQQDIIVATPLFGYRDDSAGIINKNTRISLGLIAKLTSNWKAELDYTWSKSAFSNSVNNDPFINVYDTAVREGHLDLIRDAVEGSLDASMFDNVVRKVFPFETHMHDIALRGSGELFTLPAGPVGLAFLLEHRSENMGDYRMQSFRNDVLVSSSIVYARSQMAQSAYLEVLLPIKKNAAGAGWLSDTSLQIATRYDRYSTVGSNLTTTLPPGGRVQSRNRVTSLDPTIALKSRIGGLMTLRASYGTGFVAPNVNQLTPAAPSFGTGIARDPLRGNSLVGGVSVITGGNQDLMPETSDTRAIGVILAPEDSVWRVAVDWVEIRKRDAITNLTSQAAVDIGRVERSAPLPDDQFAAGPITTLYVNSVNLTRARLEAVDIAADWHLLTKRLGELSFSARATRTIHCLVQATPLVSEAEQLGFARPVLGRVLPWRLNGAVDWQKGSWSAGWSFSWYDKYWLQANRAILPAQGSATVPSQHYHDCYLRWEGGRSENSSKSSVTQGTSLTVGVRNLFNRMPPMDLTFTNPTSQGYSTVGNPLLAQYYIRVSKEF